MIYEELLPDWNSLTWLILWDILAPVLPFIAAILVMPNATVGFGAFLPLVPGAIFGVTFGPILVMKQLYTWFGWFGGLL